MSKGKQKLLHFLTGWWRSMRFFHKMQQCETHFSWITFFLFVSHRKVHLWPEFVPESISNKANDLQLVQLLRVCGFIICRLRLSNIGVPICPPQPNALCHLPHEATNTSLGWSSVPPTLHFPSFNSFLSKQFSSFWLVRLLVNKTLRRLVSHSRKK